MRLTVNYKRIYDLIIDKRKEVTPDGYIERHHIIPRSLGGSDDRENIVELTAKEHFICHYLLTKMYPEGSGEWAKMIKAFWFMQGHSTSDHRFVTGCVYKTLREALSLVMKESQTGEGNSQYGTRWIHNPETGESAKVKAIEDIPDGWCLGRISEKDKKPQSDRDILSLEISFNQEKYEKKIHYTKWYRLYDELGFSEFCKVTGYDKSKPNLIQNFKRHVREFVPQNGKRRGN